MRKITREPIDSRTTSYLAKRQNRVNKGEIVDPAWKSARQTQTMQRVFNTLVSMAGKRVRCMYCEDSRGTDIDHYWPKADYPIKVFQWENMLLACSGCNRSKGRKFPLDENGSPLLIDPTRDDPWDYLFFEPHTGFVVPRWDAEHEAPDPRGNATTDLEILPLNIESVTEGRQRTVRRLQRAVSAFLHHFQQPGIQDQAKQDLIAAIADNDDYGLLRWFFVKSGQTNEPFIRLRTQYPGIWNELVAALETGTGDKGP